MFATRQVPRPLDILDAATAAYLQHAPEAVAVRYRFERTEKVTGALVLYQLGTEIPFFGALPPADSLGYIQLRKVSSDTTEVSIGSPNIKDLLVLPDVLQEEIARIRDAQLRKAESERLIAEASRQADAYRDLRNYMFSMWLGGYTKVLRANGLETDAPIQPVLSPDTKTAGERVVSADAATKPAPEAPLSENSANKTRKRGKRGRKSQYTEEERDDCVKEWERLDRNQYGGKLEDFLAAKFGDNEETFKPNVAKTAFYEWRADFHRRNPNWKPG